MSPTPAAPATFAERLEAAWRMGGATGADPPSPVRQRRFEAEAAAWSDPDLRFAYCAAFVEADGQHTEAQRR